MPVSESHNYTASMRPTHHILLQTQNWSLFSKEQIDLFQKPLLGRMDGCCLPLVQGQMSASWFGEFPCTSSLYPCLKAS